MRQTSITGPSGTVNIVGVERNLIIMFIFAKVGTPYLLFYKVGMQSGYPYPLFYKAGIQSGYPYPLFREADGKYFIAGGAYLLFFKAVKSGCGYPYLLFREAGMLIY
jgi:hypothetical protein